MTPVTILVKEPSSAVSLAAFTAQLETVLGLSSPQERESSNYDQGNYFSANIGNSKVTLFYLDAAGLEQYLFGIEIEAIQENLAHQTAQAIAKAGFPCFIPEGAWHKNRGAVMASRMSSKIPVKAAPSDHWTLRDEPPRSAP